MLLSSGSVHCYIQGKKWRIMFIVGGSEKDDQQVGSQIIEIFSLDKKRWLLLVVKYAVYTNTYIGKAPF